MVLARFWFRAEEQLCGRHVKRQLGHVSLNYRSTPELLLLPSAVSLLLLDAPFSSFNYYMLPFLLSIITCSQLYLVSVFTRSPLLVLSCDIAFLVSGDPVIILMSEPVFISSKLECIGVGQRGGGHLLCEQ